MSLSFRLLNAYVSPEHPVSGNPLCAFDNPEGLSEDDMQAIARQMSMETIFVGKSEDGAPAKCSFFHPSGQIGFAGSPTLSSAFVIADRDGVEGPVSLSLGDETITVDHEGDLWKLKARYSTASVVNTEARFLAGLVGRPTDSLGTPIMRVKGSRVSLVMPLKSPEDVEQAHIDARLLHQYALLLNTEPQVYLFAARDDDTIVSRMFFGPGGGVTEVAATGSGAANLGGWLAANGHTGIRRTVVQGAQIGRQSVIDLVVNSAEDIIVGGRVAQVGAGTFDW